MKIENQMKETLKKLEEYSKTLGEDITDTLGEDFIKSDKKILEEVGLDLEELEKMQDGILSEVDNKIEILYVNKSTLDDPVYNHKEDSGFDLRANIDDDITISSLERVLVSTGLYFQIHEDYELQVRPRSGLAAKYGISVLNTPGTVDSNYRGEIKVILVNLSKDNYTIKRGDRIAQGVISYVLKQKWSTLKKVKSLGSSSRDSGGFGSTGKN